MIVLVQACQSDVVYSKYQSLENASWEQSNQLQFKMIMKDSINTYDLFINIRNNKDYAFSNLFLITQMTFPDNTKVIDTLEYEMTDKEGYFLGTGFSDIKENKLFYKEKVYFKNTGVYLFQVRQAMRKRNKVAGINSLQGVTDVGISVERVK
jgi:gliding motility-associated lipoprotein GldH